MGAMGMVELDIWLHLCEPILPVWASGRWMPLVPGAQEDETCHKLWEQLEGDKHRLTCTGQWALQLKSCCA